MRTFLIAALPRSRTAWLAAFFNQRTISCEHELLADVKPDVFKDHVMQLASPVCGSAETAALLYPTVGYHVDCTVVIERPLPEIARSLTRVGINLTRSELVDLKDKLEYLAKETNALRIKFENIDEMLPRIHNFIAPNEVFDARRSKFMRKMEIQITASRWSELFDAAKTNHVLA